MSDLALPFSITPSEEKIVDYLHSRYVISASRDMDGNTIDTIEWILFDRVWGNLRDAV